METARELEVLIRARYPIITCESFEESRVTSMIHSISEKRNIELLIWTVTKGFVNLSDEVVDKSTAPDKALRYIAERKTDACFLLKDFHPFLKDASIIRMLRDLCATLKTSRKNVILLSPVVQIPIELSKEMAVLTVPLPTRDEIQDLLHKVEPDAQIEAVEASLGLTREEIENVYAKSIVKHGKIRIDEVLSEKRQIVQKAGLLEFVNITGDFDEVGGLENLKSWLIKRKKGFTAEARALNLPAPKGLLLVGLPGCGKSLTAFCTGAAWKMPLLRLDMGKIFSGLVGSSEANIRLAISTAESVAPCILWIDEIEKGMGGGQGGDGGTTSRVFGSFLTWMQEKKAPVFVLATANDISALPPEMLRKGRFDEIFFVDTPRAAERLTILDIHLKKRSWLIEKFCPDTFTDKTDQFTGAEIEQALIDAAYDAYFVGENLHMTHLETALIRTVPLAKTMKEKISSIRSWAQDRAVPAARSEIMHSQKMRVLER